MGPIRRVVIAMVLIKPVRRWMAARLREAAADYLRVTFIARPQAALRAVLPSGLEVLISEAPTSGASAEANLASAVGQGRRIPRSMLIGMLVTISVASAALVAAAVVRSRRRADTSGPALTAVPVLVPASDDELESIKGIGPETAGRLRSIGITSVAQIASWSQADIERVAPQIESSAGHIELEDWVGQARSASGGTGTVAAATA